MRAGKLPGLVTATAASVAVLAASVSPAVAQSVDAAAARAKAAQCVACHGPNGIATLPGAPNLAGQDEMYLAKAMRDFKTGARQDAMMTLMMQPLSDEDIQLLAAYYNAIRIEVVAPTTP